MMGRSHLLISTGVTISVLGMANQKISLPVIAIAAVSALLPDIDEPNSLIVSRAIPTGLIRVLQTVLVAFALYVQFFGSMLTPWNTALAVMVGLVSFMPPRTLRNVVMTLIGIGLITLGQGFIPWNFILGSVLIICSLVPHRGLTHTVYGVIGWTGLLYFATHTYGHELWMAGGLSYMLHLLTDALTNHGIRPLPPFNFQFKLKLMSTCTWTGNIVEKVCIGLTLVLVWFTFLHELDLKTFIAN